MPVGNHNILLGLRPAQQNVVAKHWKIRQNILDTCSLQVAHAQRGHGEIDIGKLHTIGKGSQIVYAIAYRIPVDGVAKAVIGITTSFDRIAPCSAVSHLPYLATVDLNRHGFRLTNPSANQSNSTLEGTRLRTFQIGGKRCW